LLSPEDFEQVVLRETSDGGIVRLRDVARVELGAQDYSTLSRLNGKPSAIIAVYQLPGSNAVDAAAGVNKLMSEMKQRFPQDMDYVIALDTTKAVTAGIKEIIQALVIAIVLVIIVVYIFLQGWRATLIPMVAVPVALVGTLCSSLFLDSLLTPFPFLGSCLPSAWLSTMPSLSWKPWNVTLRRALLPKSGPSRDGGDLRPGRRYRPRALRCVYTDGLYPGITGRLYQQFAVTIAVSVILSAFNALTLSPALAGRLLRPRQESKGLLRRSSMASTVFSIAPPTVTFASPAP